MIKEKAAKLQSCKYHSGFTILEMSISLLAISTLVFLVLGTNSLIKKRQLSNIASDISRYKSAIVDFKSKHGSLPGDIAVISVLPGSSSGNGNGVIESGEDLEVWRHLSLEGLIAGNYDGISTYVVGRGYPASSIDNAGYKIKIPSTITADGIPDQAIVIELASSNGIDDSSLPTLTAEDAKYLDEKYDDGKPESGNIMAEGFSNDCVTSGGAYNVANEVVSCRILFIIIAGKSSGDAPNISGECAEIGQSRTLSDVGQSCPTGYIGKIVETCRIDENNHGIWEVTERSCSEVSCGNNYNYGDTRKLSCINNMLGNGIVERCNESGVWEIVSSECQLKTTSPCDTNGIVREKPQACDWGQSGYMIQMCTNNKWGNPTTNTCSDIMCDGDNIGSSQDSLVSCGTDYSGVVKEVCTMAGSWEITPIASTCIPLYSGTCTASVSSDKDIGCPPGYEGAHILTCVNAETDYWTTLRDTCEPIKCNKIYNVGYSRVKIGKSCDGDSNGLVIEYCNENGEWVESQSNCVPPNVICAAPNDLAGNAYWHTVMSGTTATSTVCYEGYEYSTAPTRDCDSDGNWSNTVTNPCTRITCPATPLANYNGTAETEDDAIYPVTYAGDYGVSATSCQDAGYAAPPGYPIADCGLDGTWSNERIMCKVSETGPCPGVVGPVMGMPLCPEGDINYASQSGEHGCARMIEGGGCDPNNIDDVMFYAGDVPGTTTDFFVRRCDISHDWDPVDERCEYSDGNPATRDTYQWKDANTESATVNVSSGSLWTTLAAIDGPGNTVTLLGDTSGIHAAAELCAALGSNWYLPAISELDVIYANLVGIDDPDHPLPTVNNSTDDDNMGTTGPLRGSFNVTGMSYWSSSGYNIYSIFAWLQRFSDGYQRNNFKTNYMLVRCARR